MLYLIDTANLDAIKKCCEYYPVAGVTTNPTIISKENTDFKKLLYSIREIIGDDKMLHVQTTAMVADEILKEAIALQNVVGNNFYLKIPITKEGLKATAMCKDKGFGVTMTAIFTQQQALLAANAGADFVAPYINRLDNIVSDGVHVVEEIVNMFKMYDIKTKILAASFKNAEQVHKCASVACHSVTVTADILKMLISHPMRTPANNTMVRSI